MRIPSWPLRGGTANDQFAPSSHRPSVELIQLLVGVSSVPTPSTVFVESPALLRKITGYENGPAFGTVSWTLTFVVSPPAKLNGLPESNVRGDAAVAVPLRVSAPAFVTVKITVT